MPLGGAAPPRRARSSRAFTARPVCVPARGRATTRASARRGRVTRRYAATARAASARTATLHCGARLIARGRQPCQVARTCERGGPCPATPDAPLRTAMPRYSPPRARCTPRCSATPRNVPLRPATACCHAPASPRYLTLLRPDTPTTPNHAHCAPLRDYAPIRPGAATSPHAPLRPRTPTPPHISPLRPCHAL